MDQRIAYVANLKNHLSLRSSFQNLAAPLSPEKKSPEDVEYEFIRKQIEESSFFVNASRHISIRLHNWVDRLDKISSNKVWVANRNNYIKLLNLMCHCEYLTNPFLQLPPECDLPNLRKHQITKIIDEVEREIKTSRMTSRKVSINLDNAISSKQKGSLNNFNYDLKRFKTQSYTNGEDDSDTVLLKNWNVMRTFQTDFDDKTISFNLSTTQKNWFSKPNDSYENDAGNQSLDRYKTKPLKTNSSKQELREITNYDTRATTTHQSAKRKEEAFKRSNKPPMYKRAKMDDTPRKQSRRSPSSAKQNQCKQKEYWESIDVTGNNSGVGTPKYLDKYQMSEEKLNDSVVIVSFREGDGESCDCTSKMLGEGWLSQLLKRIAI